MGHIRDLRKYQLTLHISVIREFLNIQSNLISSFPRISSMLPLGQYRVSTQMLGGSVQAPMKGAMFSCDMSRIWKKRAALCIHQNKVWEWLRPFPLGVQCTVWAYRYKEALYRDWWMVLYSHVKEIWKKRATQCCVYTKRRILVWEWLRHFPLGQYQVSTHMVEDPVHAPMKNAMIWHNVTQPFSLMTKCLVYFYMNTHLFPVMT